jgi:hypothetical protein
VCLSQFEKRPGSQRKIGPLRYYLVVALAGTCHLATVCQSACWPLGRHYSDFDCTLIIFVCCGYI